jgi:glycosyltransferase involved in cell wall biosynthesis
MLVSVIVPTYNRAHMIAGSLHSILDQTYKNIEIIVVDDGSTDNTEEVVKQIAAGAAQPILYVKKPNGGCASARNRGVRHAKGDGIAFLDSDDRFLPHAIESLVTTLLASDADFVYSPSVEVDINGKEVTSIPAAAGRPDKLAREHFFTLGARACCILYRKYIFEKFQLDETAKYNEDSDFLQRVAINFSAAYSPTPTARVIQHGGNKSSNQREICRALVRSYENILRDYPEFAAALGSRAVRRVDELKMDLIQVLVEQQALAEAHAVAGTMVRMNAAVKLGLRFHSGIPIAIRRHCHLLMHIARRIPEVVFERLNG